MTPSEYEIVFADIISGLRSDEQSPKDLSINSGSKNRIPGASGYKHQIDVSFNYKSRLFIVECKRWKKRIGVAEILVLASRKQDIEIAQKGSSVSAIIASLVGASMGAKQLAKHFEVEIAEAKSAHEFGLRLGDSVFRAVQDLATISDKAWIVVDDKQFQR